MGDRLELHPSFRNPRRCVLSLERPSCSLLSLSPQHSLVNRMDILAKALSRGGGCSLPDCHGEMTPCGFLCGAG